MIWPATYWLYLTAQISSPVFTVDYYYNYYIHTFILAWKLQRGEKVQEFSIVRGGRLKRKGGGLFPRVGSWQIINNLLNFVIFLPKVLFKRLPKYSRAQH